MRIEKLSFLVNLAAGQISIRYGFESPIVASVTASAAGMQAVGDAARMIRAGEWPCNPEMAH